MTIADKTERNTRLDEIEAETAASRWPAPPTRRAATPKRRPQVKRAFRSLQKEVVAQPHRQRGRAHRRPRHRRHPAAVAPRSASSPPRTAPASSSGARRRCCRSLTLGMPRMEQIARHDHARRPRSATCTTTTSRRSPPARRVASVRRSAARSVTARSPSGRWCPSSRARRSGPTRCASSPTCSRRTAPRRWRRSAARRSR